MTVKLCECRKHVKFAGNIHIVLTTVFETVIMPQLEEYTALKLREKAKALRLVATGMRAELLARITEADPSCRMIDE